MNPSNTIFRVLYEKSPFGVVIISIPHGITLMANQAACKLLGYTETELLNVHLESLILPDEEELQSHLHQLLNKEISSIELELPYQTKESHAQWIKVEMSLITDDQSKFEFVLCALHCISNKKKTEEELEESSVALKEKERQLSMIFNFTSDSLILLKVEPNGKFTCQAANQAYLKRANSLFQGSAFEMIGKDRREFLEAHGVPQHIIENEINQHQKVLETRLRLQYKTTYPTVPVSYLETTIEPIKDSTGDCTHLLRNVRDITERKKTEQALKESEERLRLALNAGNQGIYDINLTTGEVKVTDEYATMLGFSLSDFKESEAFWVSRLHPEDKERSLAYFHDYLEGKVDDYRTEFRLKTKSGTWIWILSVGKIVTRGENGKPLRMLGTHTDITHHKLSEQTFQRTNKELQEVIDALDQSSLVSITDRAGTIIKVNNRFCNVARYKREELIGQNHRVINSGHHSKDFWKDFWKTIGKGEVWKGEIKNRAKDGTEYWVDTVINPIRNERGEISHYLSIRQDITDRKVYEQLLLQSNFRLAQIEQFVDLTTDVIQVAREDGQLVYINKVGAERLGIAQEECRNFNVKDCNPEFAKGSNWKKHINSLKEVEFLTVDGWNTNISTGESYPVEITARLVNIQDVVYRIAIIRDISERRRNELALMESEARLVEAQKMASLGYWELDLLSYKPWWSDEQYEINGFKKSEPISQKIFESLIHPDDREWFKDAMNELLTTSNEISATYRIIRPDGEVRVIQGKCKKNLNDQGQPIKLSGVNQDITERVFVEKELREREQTLLKTQRVAKIGSWKLDVKNNILEWSDEAYKIFNVSPGKNLTYKDFLSYVHPEDKEYVDQSWSAAVKGAQYDIVHRIVINNIIKWVREQAELTFDEYNDLLYGFGTVQDITDQKTLQDVNQIFNQSQLLTGLGSWRYTIKSKELFWSDNVFNLYGVNKVTTKPTYELFLSIIHPEDHSRVKRINELRLAGYAGGDSTFETEYRVTTLSGEIKWISSKGNVIYDKDGEPLEMYGIIRDITLEKANTEELLKAKKEAENAGLIKDEFLSVMSHEIRTPLNSVIGLSNLLLKRTPREDQLEIMKTLKGSADNLLHLVNDILDFNKIRAGKLELEFIPFNLTKFLKHLHASFALSAIEKGLEFKIHVDTHLPEVLVGDVTRLNQIFNNLITNAIKFTNKGHVKFLVDLKSKTKDRCVLIFKIEDTGIGIPADKLGSIFQPFNQSNLNISREYGGTGLGLSIVKLLVDILQGKLSVKSKVNKGSVFQVEIEFLISNDEASLALPFIPSSSTESQVKSSRKELKVLYVEDVESNRFLIENLLSDNYIDCITVSSGKAALHLTKLKKFDLILMDIQMPGMDGYQTTEKIKNQIKGKNKQTPVIAFTAEHYSDALMAKVVQHGIQDLITKPFDYDTLLKKIAVNTWSQVATDKIFSFSFYEEVFDHDSKKIKKIRLSVVKDVQRFEKKLALYNKQKDLIKMREEVHRIRPIIKNLKCTELVKMLDAYRSYETYGPEIVKLTRSTIQVVKKLERQLLKLK